LRAGIQLFPGWCTDRPPVRTMPNTDQARGLKSRETADLEVCVTPPRCQATETGLTFQTCSQ
jgi:hypothetical protein